MVTTEEFDVLVAQIAELTAIQFLAFVAHKGGINHLFTLMSLSQQAKFRGAVEDNAFLSIFTQKYQESDEVLSQLVLNSEYPREALCLMNILGAITGAQYMNGLKDIGASEVVEVMSAGCSTRESSHTLGEVPDVEE